MVTWHLFCSLGKGAPSWVECLPVTQPLQSSSSNHRQGWKTWLELDVIWHLLQLATCFLLSCPVTFSYPCCIWSCTYKYKGILVIDFLLMGSLEDYISEHLDKLWEMPL